jgi:pimeloyl-ACP methyl ester carboxylesterase
MPPAALEGGVVVRSAPNSGRSPVLAIVVSILVGGVLALALAYVLAPDGSEPLVTGSVLLAFALGWALMAWLTTKFSGQPQRWVYVTAASLGGVGAVLAVLQPGPAVMDLLGWVWPIALAVLAIWMFLQLRRNLRGFGRWLIGGLTVVLFLMAVVGAAMTVAAASASQRAGQGQLVDIGGRRLYLKCTGSGSPAVILQSGAGGDSTAWQRIQPTIAATTTVCAYDRAGRGLSDDAPSLQDGNAIARDLHDLLARAGIPGPYVVVGHSSGGPYLRVYAATFPADVAGMVLLDPQPATAFTALPDYPSIYEYLKLSGGLAPSLARIGLLGPIFGVGPTEATPAVARSYRDEIRMLPTALDQATRVTSIGGVPLIIVSAGTGSQRGWAEAQDAQVGLSTNSAHRTLSNATHDSLLDADTAASAQAILEVIAAVRDGASIH